MQNLILSCDWGTSSFRLKLVEVPSRKVLGEVCSEGGAASTFQRWKEYEQHVSREQYFLQQLGQQMQAISNELSVGLSDIPVVISGMASSSIGIKELPYAALPFSIDGSNAIVSALPAPEGLSSAVWLISGLGNEADVMRGEETQLIGLAAMNSNLFSEAASVCIFPGTHSKHITVEKGKIIGSKTYITGELFGLLRQHSILGSAVAAGEDQTTFSDQQMRAFDLGVEKSRTGNLLHLLFSVRVNDLFGRCSREENFSYLSGLLIGTELKDIQDAHRILLCCGSRMHLLYEAAIAALGLRKQTEVIAADMVDQAAAAGHLAIFKNRIQKSK